jgi:hypothetical protein
MHHLLLLLLLNVCPQVTKYMHTMGAFSEEHRTRILRRRTWDSWRQFVVLNKAKSGKALKALSFWTGRSLQVGRARCSLVSSMRRGKGL